MIYFLNKLESSDQKYKNNGTVKYDNYKGKLSFNMKDFVSFGTDSQSIYFISIKLLKDKINGVRVPKFQLD